MSSSNERAVKAYLCPAHCKLVKGYAEYTGKSTSQVVAEAIKQRFEKMPQAEKEMIMRKGEQ